MFTSFNMNKSEIKSQDWRETESYTICFVYHDYIQWILKPVMSSKSFGSEVKKAYVLTSWEKRSNENLSCTKGTQNT